MPAPGQRPAFGQRVKLSLLITVVTLIPALVMLAVTYAATGQPQAAATWASIPAVAGIVAAAAGGRGFAIRAGIVMAFLAPLTIVAGQSPVSGAAVMALMCLGLGGLSRLGLRSSGLLVPVMMAWPLIDPPAWSGATTVDRLDTGYLLWMTLIFAVGGLIPAFVVPWAMRKRPKSTLKPSPLHEALTYTVMITVLVTAGTYYILDSPNRYGGAFLIAAILVLAPIGTAQTLKPTVIRVVSTVAGSVLVIAMVSQVDSLAIIYLIGTVLILVALVARFSGQMWLYYALMVPATASLNATSMSQVGQLGTQRVVDNAVGGALVLLATLVTIGFSRWSEHHGHASDTDEDVEAAVSR